MSRYSPEPVPLDSAELPSYFAREMAKLQAAFNDNAIDYLNVAPDKPYDGLLVVADGTNWNPGSGQGVYCYYNSTWNKL
jgi:hypothetical protein